MKKISLSGTLILLSALAFGQNTVQINGTVTDAKGPVPFAFIYSSAHPYATYADSTGSFSMKADAASPIVATAVGHDKKIMKIDNPSSPISIVLTPDASVTAVTISPDLKNVFQQEEAFQDMTAGSLLMKGSNQENVHGSRFLFPDWVHGYIITTNDSVQQTTGYGFNYDKMNGNLIFATGGTDMHMGVRDQIKQFILVDDKGVSYVFEMVPAINTTRYMRVLAQGNKYKIYKDINTQFVKNDFVNNGVTTHGNNFDQFLDNPDYYVVKLPGGTPEKISLRKKSLKNAFAADADKVNKYLSANDGDIDDTYLANLGDAMNQ